MNLIPINTSVTIIHTSIKGIVRSISITESGTEYLVRYFDRRDSPQQVWFLPSEIVEDKDIN